MTTTNMQSTQEPESEESFLSRVDVSLAAWHSLQNRIEEDAAMCIGLGGTETGMVEIGLTSEEWCTMTYHLAYSSGRLAPELGASTHTYWTKYGSVRLYIGAQ